MNNIFSKQYLQKLKQKQKQETSSKALIEALKQLQNINKQHQKQNKLLREQIEKLNIQNNFLVSCLEKMKVDYQQYRTDKQVKFQQNVNKQIQLQRQVQKLQSEKTTLLNKIEQLTLQLNTNIRQSNVYSDYSSKKGQSLLYQHQQQSQKSFSKSLQKNLENIQNKPYYIKLDLDQSPQSIKNSENQFKNLNQSEIENQILTLNQSNRNLTKNIFTSNGQETAQIRTRMRNNNRQIAKLKNILNEFKTRETLSTTLQQL